MSPPSDGARPVEPVGFFFVDSDGHRGPVVARLPNDADLRVAKRIAQSTELAYAQSDYDALGAEVERLKAELCSLIARAEAAEATITETRKHLNFAMFSSNPQEIHDRVLAACAALNEGDGE